MNASFQMISRKIALDKPFFCSNLNGNTGLFHGPINGIVLPHVNEVD